MEVQTMQGVANPIDPESCIVALEGGGEALTGERAGLGVVPGTLLVVLRAIAPGLVLGGDRIQMPTGLALPDLIAVEAMVRNNLARALSILNWRIGLSRKDLMDASKRGEKVTVLFVESEGNLCRMIARLLSGSRPDVAVVFAADGNQAIEMITNFRAEEKCLDLLVTDYAHPPGPHGVELIRWVRELPDDFTMGDGRRISQIPIIMQSVNHRAHTAQDVDPDVAMLPKPYKLDSFLAAMDMALQKTRNSLG